MLVDNQPLRHTLTRQQLLFNLLHLFVSVSSLLHSLISLLPSIHPSAHGQVIAANLSQGSPEGFIEQGCAPVAY